MSDDKVVPEVSHEPTITWINHSAVWDSKRREFVDEQTSVGPAVPISEIFSDLKVRLTKLLGPLAPDIYRK